MKASDVMSGPVIAVRPETPLRDIARTLVERRISAVPVMDGERLVGVVSEADVLRPGAATEGHQARDVMTSDVATVAVDTPLEDIAALLAARGIRRVPVVQRGRVVGIVSRANLVRALAVKPIVDSAQGEEDAGVRVAWLERLGSEPWWRGGESRRAEPRPGPTYGVRRASDRGHSRHGWADTYYSFSFGDFYDPAYMSYGPLQAINETVVQPLQGSTTYGVRDVEIITYVIEGMLGHDNSLDDAAAVPAGAVQCLSAGSGVRFCEVNEGRGPARFLQMWVEPNRTGVPPAYANERFPAERKRGRLQPLVTPDGREGSLCLRQDAFLYAGLFDGAETARLQIAAGRLAYVQVARGRIAVWGEELGPGDGLGAPGGAVITLDCACDAEVLVFDLPERAV
ncbi:MAG TPA: CBS domain-containing protein [Burkholderiales bacterium]|nr:CBS domain-containing protein [Burkholderiales bacterium]